MKKLLQELTDIKTAVTALMVVVTTLSAAYSQVDRVTDSMVQKAYAELTSPAYKIVEYDLLKQLEKLQNYPGDIKRQDIIKFTDFCDGYFGQVYVTLRPTLIERDLKIACSRIIQLYNEGSNT
jgi:hypothetical protein